jgi:hypothetical protein
MSDIQLVVINCSLVIAVSIQTILIWLLTRGKVKSFYKTTFIYITLLFLIETLSSIFLINTASTESALINGKIRFIAECFILAAAFTVNQYFMSDSFPPKFSIKNLLPYIIAFPLSAGALLGLIIKEIQKTNGVYFPNYSAFYWIMVTFFGFILFTTAFDLYKKLRILKQTGQYPQIREIIWLVALFFIAIFPLYILPFGGFFYPTSFLGYLLITVIILYSCFRFYLIKLDKYSKYILPQIIISSMFLFTLFFLRAETIHLDFLLLSIFLFLLLTSAGIFILVFSQNFRKNLQKEQTEYLHLKVDEFKTSVSKIFDIKQLWEYLGSFLQSNFEFNLKEYSRAKIQKLLSEPNSPLLEHIEESKTILYRSDYPPDSLLNKKMTEFQVNLGIPLEKNGEVLAIVFLDGNQNKSRISQIYLSTLNQIGVHAAIAIDNIHTIQDKLFSVFYQHC